MTSGYPSDATENAVQANIVAAGYATSTSQPGTGPTPGTRLSLQATTSCCTADYVTHSDTNTNVGISQITGSSTATLKADATWIVRAGLGSGSCVSFESANKSGQYLRHSGFQVYLQSNDGSSQFAQDATFCAQAGNNGRGFSFQSLNYPGRYFRHYSFTLYVASNGGSNTFDSSNLWADDTSWLASAAWS